MIDKSFETVDLIPLDVMYGQYQAVYCLHRRFIFHAFIPRCLKL